MENGLHFSTFIIWINRVVLTKMEVLQDQSESFSLHYILNQSMLYTWCLFPIHFIWWELYITSEDKDSQKAGTFSSTKWYPANNTFLFSIAYWFDISTIWSTSSSWKNSSRGCRGVQSLLLLSNLSISKFLKSFEIFYLPQNMFLLILTLWTFPVVWGRTCRCRCWINFRCVIIYLSCFITVILCDS